MPSRQINEFSQKGNRKKIELVVRPALYPVPSLTGDAGVAVAASGVAVNAWNVSTKACTVASTWVKPSFPIVPRLLPGPEVG